MLTPQLFFNVLCCRLLWALPQPYFQTLLLSKRFHSISVLTANFQAASDTFPHPLNHLTAIFFKTSTFCLLPIYHPPFLHLCFSLFIYPCAFRQPWRWGLLLQLLPTFPRLLPSLMALPRAAEGELNPATTTLYLSGSLQVTPFYPAIVYWADLMPLGKTQFLSPGAWACCSPLWFRKALLNDKLPGYHKDFAANSPTRAKTTFPSEDAAYEMQ